MCKNTYFYISDHLGSTSMVLDADGNISQSISYIPCGEIFVEERNGAWNTPYLFNSKELDEETGFYYYGARYLNPTNGMWLSVDPLWEKYVGMSPYNYCMLNPVMMVDPDGRAWRANTDADGHPTGYEWVPESSSYDDRGELLPDLYEQAIFFSHGGSNGNYSPKSRFNMGTSTATVYKKDGTIENFDACTYPADANLYATVPEGTYEAKVGKHNGKYPALRLSEKGTENFYSNKIDLKSPNPRNKKSNFAYGINIHKAGKSNLTGTYQDSNKKTHGVSEGCLLIDIFKWDEFMSNFLPNKNSNIGVSVSRTPRSDWKHYLLPPGRHIPSWPGIYFRIK